ncbi:hypothetical protein K9L16_00555 [Candidatus Pacearchaeota archaeon]|nr:hypothetical protein [Candidatus Pacearchaeota archaeon]
MKSYGLGVEDVEIDKIPQYILDMFEHVFGTCDCHPISNHITLDGFNNRGFWYVVFDSNSRTIESISRQIKGMRKIPTCKGCKNIRELVKSRLSGDEISRLLLTLPVYK